MADNEAWVANSAVVKILQAGGLGDWPWEQIDNYEGHIYAIRGDVHLEVRAYGGVFIYGLKYREVLRVCPVTPEEPIAETLQNFINIVTMLGLPLPEGE